MVYVHQLHRDNSGIQTQPNSHRFCILYRVCCWEDGIEPLFPGSHYICLKSAAYSIVPVPNRARTLLLNTGGFRISVFHQPINGLFHLILIGKILLQIFVPDNASDTSINLIELLLAHIDESDALTLPQRSSVLISSQTIETDLHHDVIEISLRCFNGFGVKTTLSLRRNALQHAVGYPQYLPIPEAAQAQPQWFPLAMDLAW
ncbi:Uncharacterised protein [Serratia marcescens]|nr:Uncharacterised protein [Serratia marcescens]